MVTRIWNTLGMNLKSASTLVNHEVGGYGSNDHKYNNYDVYDGEARMKMVMVINRHHSMTILKTPRRIMMRMLMQSSAMPIQILIIIMQRSALLTKLSQQIKTKKQW